MELCPRCTSTVADRASTCPRCGAEIWQPGALTHQVAVTPAPVAFVPPVPAVAPPPLPATPPPLPAAPPPLPAAVQPPALPPQRVAPPEAEPQSTPIAIEVDETPPATPIRSETVVPATPPTPSRPNGKLIAVATIAPLLAVVVLIVALPAQGAKPKHVTVVATDSDARFNLRALAAAEETNLTATETYTTDSDALDAAGYQPAPGKPVTINAGVSTTGYCLVATAGGKASWFLYDSKQGGLVSSDFAAEELAQQACADGAIKSYLPIV